LTDPLAVGVVGLGAMGGGIIRRLHDVGYEVLGLDVETSKRESVERDGIRTARSIEELARSVDVILTSLPNTEAVSDVVLGPQGLIDVAGRRVDTVIEMSTINPNVWQEIAETVLSNGLHCLDAPVTGGPDEARAGELKMYVGGDEDLIARWSELLSVLGDVISVGGTGAGHVVKIVNNLMSIANIAVAAEAMALGVSAGMEPSKLFDALAVGGGRSHGFLKRFPRVVAGDLAPRAPVSLCLKDLRVIRELAAATGLQLHLLPSITGAYEATSELGYGALDFAAVVRLYEHEAGIDISRRTQGPTGAKS
jgi:3-hydroxyisobutyrate dehydrogenase